MNLTRTIGTHSAIMRCGAGAAWRSGTNGAVLTL